MSRTSFPVTHSIPSIAALLRDIVPDYAIAPTTGGCFLNIGMNDTFRVETTEKPYVLRVYRYRWRSRDEIHAELAVLQHLKRRGVAVAAPIARRDGTFLSTIETPEGPRDIALFDFAPGKDLSYDADAKSESLQRDGLAYRYGCSVAAVHNLTDGLMFDRPRLRLDFENLLDRSLRLIQTKLCDRLGRSSDGAYFQQLGQRLRRAIEALPIDRLDWGFCHGDFHGGNAHIDTDGIVTCFDFDCCGLGWRAYDLAVFKRDLRASGQSMKIWAAFLAGYEDCRSLGELDLRAIELFLPVRHLWMLALHVENGEDWGFGWIGEDYLDRELNFLRAWETEFERDLLSQ